MHILLQFVNKVENIFFNDTIMKKEEGYMKNFKSVLTKMVRNTAEIALKRDANSTTCTAVYQPKAPASLDKFKKHID